MSVWRHPTLLFLSCMYVCMYDVPMHVCINICVYDVCMHVIMVTAKKSHKSIFASSFAIVSCTNIGCREEFGGVGGPAEYQRPGHPRTGEPKPDWKEEQDFSAAILSGRWRRTGDGRGQHEP